MRRAGSPGRTWTNMNTASVTPSSVGVAESRRRKIYEVMIDAGDGRTASPWSPSAPLHGRQSRGLPRRGSGSLNELVHLRELNLNRLVGQHVGVGHLGALAPHIGRFREPHQRCVLEDDLLDLLVDGIPANRGRRPLRVAEKLVHLGIA